jgi:anti-sigma regulatory factor (Ser/Thr protein kinase)/Fe-S-cluster-containing hydrogenase component 2
MNPTSYPIAGGDYTLGGTASRRLKEQLKQIGAAPDAIRRAMIAAYEAEMNVVIHARRGALEARLGPGRLDVEVADEGPGIPDIPLAMKEGFSTAPAEARALGFGAGMGLPNIRKNSDVFSIESTVGRSTRVRFTIYLKPQEAAAGGRHSIRIAAARCRVCLACLRACPTRAMRVRPATPGLAAGPSTPGLTAGGQMPKILEHLCIDCAACLGACDAGALTMAGGAHELPSADDAVLVLPSAFLHQFGPGVGPARVLAALAQLGFRDVRTSGPWEEALRAAVLQHARSHPVPGPILSPVCPAIVNLVEMRFPSLIGQLAPLLSPMEAMCADLEGRRALFVAECPCERSALESDAAKPEIIAPAVLRDAIAPILAADHAAGVSAAETPHPFPSSEPDAGLSAEALAKAEASGRSTTIGKAETDREVLRVTGLIHVLRALEEAENGRMGDVAVLELYACDEGCFGSPLLTEDPFVALHRSHQAAEPSAAPARAIRRARPYAPRAGLRLDHDMTRAIEKLSKIQQLLRTLPGNDCGLCGSPTCAALAEDIVLGRAGGAVCVHRSSKEGVQP